MYSLVGWIHECPLSVHRDAKGKGFGREKYRDKGRVNIKTFIDLPDKGKKNKPSTSEEEISFQLSFGKMVGQTHSANSIHIMFEGKYTSPNSQTHPSICREAKVLLSYRAKASLHIHPI